MADFQQDPNSALGQIQKLLAITGYDPEDRAQLIAKRNQAQENYSGILNKPLPDIGPVQRMVGEYLSRYAVNPARPFAALAGATGAEHGAGQQMDTNQLLRQQQAKAEELKMANANITESDLYGKTAFSVAGRNGAFKQPSPEHLRTVYTSAMNHYAQIAKDLDFTKLDPNDPGGARVRWIQENTNSAVRQYIDNYATQPTGPRGTESQAPSASPLPSTLEERFPPAVQQPQQPGMLPPTTTEQNSSRNIPLIQEELKKPENQTPDKQLVLKQELQRELSKQSPTAVVPGSETLNQPQPAATQQISQPNATVATKVVPPARNIPAEEGAKQGAKDMAGAYVKDYETLQAEAAAAAQQKAAFDALSKIKPNTGMFANAEQVIGSLFSALGQDPTDPIIQNAMKTRSAEQVLSQLTNASLKAEKGVQTKTDEVRIYKEFPKTTDFQKVWDFSVKLGQERAQRKLDQRDFFDSVASQNNGTPTRARQLWDKEMVNDPITQYLGGQLIFRSDFINAYTKKYPQLGKDAAIQKWREMEQDYQARGGRK